MILGHDYLRIFGNILFRIYLASFYLGFFDTVKIYFLATFYLGYFQNPKKNVAIPKKNVANPKKNVANPKKNVAISIGNILVCRRGETWC